MADRARWLLWWYRALRHCGYPPLRAARRAWRVRRCDPRAVPGMMAELLRGE